MIPQLVEARRRRAQLISRIATLRAHVDRELGALSLELYAIERLEVESEKAMRELEPEFGVMETR